MTRPVNDTGESLVELLITIVVIGIAVPALIGAVLLAIDSSSQDRRQAQAQGLLTSWSERIVEQTSDATAYGSCPSLTKYAIAPYALSPLPAGFHASVQSVQAWSGAAFGGCADPDSGIRLLRLRMHVDAALYPSFDLDQYVVLRKPCPSAVTSC